MIDKLDHLVATGITAIELMPLADFAGRRNWGYDGVLLYAPDSAYGRPDDLKALIDAAHQRGLMVFLDVVYNHFGPEGNYLGRYAPPLLHRRADAVGQRDRLSRAGGARLRHRERAVLAARLSLRRAAARRRARHRRARRAVDAARSQRAPPASSPRETGRHIHLVLENDDNRASLLDAAQDPPRGKYRAQWNDDYHHAWHVLLTGETQGYYGDYRARRARISRARWPRASSIRASRRRHRGGSRAASRAAHLPPTAFVNFLQNHDQIGNRALGDRLESARRSPQAIEAALAVMLLAPMMPMLFMGEEWGSKAPFPFFCDFEGDLADAVRKGRREEFAWAYAKYGDEMPDPLAPSTSQVRRARLERARHAGRAASG